MRNICTSGNARPLAVVAVIAATLLWTAGKIAAFNPQPDPPAFGLVAMDPSETMRLNSTCPNVTVNGVAPGPCVVTLGFADVDGVMIKQTTFTTHAGGSASLDLNASEVRFEPNRAEIQPIVTAALGAGREIPSVEVFDVTSGRTDVYVSPLPRMSFIGR